MAKYSVLIGEEAEAEFLEIPFPFRRQVTQRVNKLRSDPELGEAVTGSESGRRLDVAGWRILYEVDDRERRITIVAFRKVDSGT